MIILRHASSRALITLSVGLFMLAQAHAEEAGDVFSHLVPVEDARVAAAFIDPDADFSVFERVMLLDTLVAFQSGWERSQTRGTRSSRVSARDIETI